MILEKILISLVIYLIIVKSYQVFERKRNIKIPTVTKISFLLLIVFSVFFFYPNLEYFQWIVWVLFLYSVLDDWLSKSVNILIFIVISVVVAGYEREWEMLIVGVVVVVIIRFIIEYRRDLGVGVGDVYSLLPLIVAFSEEAIVICCFAIAVMYIMVYLVKLRYREIPFMPILAIAIILHMELPMWMVPMFVVYMILYLYIIIKKTFHRK